MGVKAVKQGRRFERTRSEVLGCVVREDLGDIDEMAKKGEV